MNDLTATHWVAFYAAVVATTALFWNIAQYFLERRKQTRERRKIYARFGVTILKRKVPHFGDMHIFPLCVMNLGREDVIITSVEMRRKNSKFQPGAYNEPEAALGIYGERKLPKRLQPGDTLTLEQFTLAAFHDCPDEIVVFDSEGYEYRVPKEDIKDQFEQTKRYRDDKIST